MGKIFFFVVVVKKRERETNNNNKFYQKVSKTLKINLEGSCSPIGLYKIPLDWLNSSYVTYKVKPILKVKIYKLHRIALMINYDKDRPVWMF